MPELAWYYWLLIGLGIWIIPAGIALYVLFVLKGMGKGPLKTYGFYCLNITYGKAHNKSYYRDCPVCQSEAQRKLLWVVILWPFTYLIINPCERLFKAVEKLGVKMGKLLASALKFMNPTNVGKRLKERREQKEKLPPKAKVVSQ